jgi:hypothetical protein
VTNVSHDILVYMKAAELVNNVTNGILQSSLYNLGAILQCDISQIASILDRLQVRRLQFSSRHVEQFRPFPGTYVPLRDHHLLRQNFAPLQPGDFVAWEEEDPVDAQASDDKDDNATNICEPTYFLAQVIERVARRAVLRLNWA